MSNLLLPEHIIDAVIARLEENRELLSYKGKSVNTIAQIHQVPEDKSIAANMGFKPPWLGVFFYEGEAETIVENGEAFDVDLTIGVLCSSSPQYSRATQAVNEAQAYAKLVHKILLTTAPDNNIYFVNIGTEAVPDNKLVRLSSDKLPREIILATSDLSLCVARFKIQSQE